MAVGAHLLIFEIYFSTIRTPDHFPCNLNTTVRTRGGFITDLMTTFRTFYYCHKLFIFKGRILSLYFLAQRR